MPTISNRFEDALACHAGACNPVAIVRALERAILASRAEGIPPDKCPAVGLIAHQLAHVLRVHRMENSLAEYGRAVDECTAQVSAANGGSVDIVPADSCPDHAVRYREDGTCPICGRERAR